MAYLREQLIKEGAREAMARALGGAEEEEEDEEEETAPQGLTAQEIISGQTSGQTIRMRFHWARMASLLSDSVSTWQIPQTPQSDLLPPPAIRLMVSVREAVNRAMLIADERRFL